jgi:thiol-disulfide isomerase/thioredoxin
MKKLVLLLFFFCTLAKAQTTLPDVALTNLEGKSVFMKKDFSETDKLYLISFWATWCGPCINELDELNEVIDDWKKELNLEVIAIATDDARTQKRVKPMVNGKGWGYTILLDTNQDLKRALTIVNIPYTIVVKNNQILHIQNGYVPGSEVELLAKLKQLK